MPWAFAVNSSHQNTITSAFSFTKLVQANTALGSLGLCSPLVKMAELQWSSWLRLEPSLINWKFFEITSGNKSSYMSFYHRCSKLQVFLFASLQSNASITKPDKNEDIFVLKLTNRSVSNGQTEPKERRILSQMVLSNIQLCNHCQTRKLARNGIQTTCECCCTLLLIA